jgi:catechol 2,3-dioxygenase-like lactoylglutathione lyase family enzyme
MLGNMRFFVYTLSVGLMLLNAALAFGDVQQMTRITLTVRDLDRSVAFFEKGLAFRVVDRRSIDDEAFAHLIGIEGARIDSARLRLGEEEIELQEFAQTGQPYPRGSRSPDRWFQHFAIVVADMPKAYARLDRVRFEPISRGGPQTLPARNNHVRAFKFRDPDGHPLELLYFPPGVGPARWQQARGNEVFLGIDHSAIAVASTPQSLHFYRDLLGMQQDYAVTNHGPTQENLDATFNAVVDITGLSAISPRGPGVEFLEYRTPPIGRAAPPDVMTNDILHARMQFRVDDLDGMATALRAARVGFVSPGIVALDIARHAHARGLMVRDPDGHAILLME